MTTLKFTVKAQGIDQAADRLQRAAQRGALILSAVDAVNSVTRRADVSLREGETANINLTPAYVKSKTDVQLAATGSKPRATITTKGDLTILGNFAPLSRVVAPGAERRAGPIKGFRSAGTRVAVRKSSLQVEDQWFIMRLRQGTSTGDKFGVFVRSSSIAPSPNAKREGQFGKRHIYGPSPYALFREQIKVQNDDIDLDLRKTALQKMGDELAELLK